MSIWINLNRSGLQFGTDGQYMDRRVIQCWSIVCYINYFTHNTPPRSLNNKHQWSPLYAPSCLHALRAINLASMCCPFLRPHDLIVASSFLIVSEMRWYFAFMRVVLGETWCFLFGPRYHVVRTVWPNLGNPNSFRSFHRQFTSIFFR